MFAARFPRPWAQAAVACGLAGILSGCGGGDSPGRITEDAQSVADLSLAGVAGPPPASTPTPVSFVDRAAFGGDNTAAALAFPGLSDEERQVFMQGLDFFITPHTAQEGVGPLFNQNRCLGCHTNTESLPEGLARTATPASRAFRSGPTDHDAITAANQPPTAAFTLFGDLLVNGTFEGLAMFGGPVRHIQAAAGCNIETIPPEHIDPFLNGGVNPDTGFSPTGARRAVGERAGPPYIGRGLMEAIHAPDIAALADPFDQQAGPSTLLPPNPAGGGDFISGRVNVNNAVGAFLGGDHVVRLSRFGLRAAGPTLFQFMIGGTQGEVGLTSPFRPEEQPDPQNAGRFCDEAADPELDAETVLSLRSMIRMLGVPAPDARLFETPPVSAGAADIQAGAALFGVDLAAFQSRLTPGAAPVGVGADADRAIAADRQLNCVGCHTPLARTGTSPAALGAGHLTNKWVPLFSDLILHDMGEVAPGRNSPVPPPPSLVISRNLADFALPGQGTANGREWRTPPLMGMGVIGPPFLHDGRVFLNPAAPATTVATSSAGDNLALSVDTFDRAVLAAIELHDLPVPDPALPADIAPALDSINRSEARLVMQRWRLLTPAQQLQVVRFLRSL